MPKVLFRARDSFGRDQRGNVAILFAFSAIPLVGLLGGAVDMARHARYKTQLLNAMDASAIALVRRGAKDDAEADKFVNDYMAAALPSFVAASAKPDKIAVATDKMLHMARFDAQEIEGGYRVVSDGYMDSGFMGVVGINQMPLDLDTEVMMTSGKFEVALALDNTGSMAHHGRIEALREAAGNLVETLYDEEGTKDRLSMALVPFVTAVNVKTLEVYDPAWIDATSDASDFAFGAAVNKLDLFKQMHVEWKGCVEARLADETEDTEPTDDATRWVPYLWPDEPDGGRYGNSYLKDVVSGEDRVRLADTAKYSATKVADTTSKGPNAACPRPIVELTNDDKRLKDEIDRMVPHNTSGGNSSGTNVSQGLMWGWRVLSPGEPYSQGAPYGDGETTKVLVLLSDGRNQIVPNNDVTRSDYTSYGYLAAGRLGSTKDYLAAERSVDKKVAEVCEKVKDTGIRVYTILFEVDFAETQDLFRDCASTGEDGKPLYYYVPDASQLETAFAKIGEDLTTLRVTR